MKTKYQKIILLLPILIFLLSFITTSIFAGNYSGKDTIIDQTILRDTILADDYFREAGNMSDNAKYNLSILYYQKAAQLYAKHKLWNKCIHSLHQIGENHTRLLELDSALVYYQKALSISRSHFNESHPIQATNYFHIGKCLYKKRNYDEALEYYSSAVEAYTKTLKSNAHISKNQSEIATYYSKMADCYYEKRNYQEASRYYKKAVGILTKILGEDHPKMVQPYNSMGNIHMQKRDYDGALKYYQKALTIRLKNKGEHHLDVAWSFNDIGNCYRLKGDYDKALNYHNKALDIRLKSLSSDIGNQDHPDIATSYNNIGNCYAQKRDYEEAFKYYEKALNILVESDKTDHSAIADSYGNIGTCYKEKGNYEQALLYHNKALKIRTRISGNEHPKVAVYYQSIGTCYYETENYHRALKYYEKALAKQTKIFEKDHPDIATSYDNIGSCYQAMGERNIALKYHTKALNIQSKIFGYNHPQIAITYNNIGTCHMGKGNCTLALEYYNKALRIQSKTYRQNRPEMAVTYENIGACLIKKENYTMALSQYQQALISLSNGFKDTTITSNPPLNHIRSKKELLDILSAKANILSRIYDETHSIEHLRLSFSTYQLAISLIDSIRIETAFIHPDQKIPDVFMAVYNTATKQAFQLYELTNERDFLSKAFVITEKNKTFLSLQNINDIRAKHDANIPDSLINKEGRLKTSIALYKKKLIDLKNTTQKKEQDSVNVRLYENKLFDKNRELSQFTTSLKRDYPQYYPLKNDLSVTSLEDIQSRLRKKTSNTAFLNFFMGDNILYLFTITSDSFYTDVIPLDSSLFDQIYDLRKGIIDPNLFRNEDQKAFELYTINAYNLYNKLLKKTLDRINQSTIQKLIIVPDRYLVYLPFELLFTKSFYSKRRNYNVLPYLLKQYVISYHQSATLLALQLESKYKRKKARYPYLGIAPDYVNTNKTTHNEFTDLSPLYYNTKEVEDGYKYFNGKAFSGDQASEKIFKKYASDAAIIHLPAHTKLDNIDPLYSKIYFTPNIDTIEDGVLNIYEIYNTPMNAQLAIIDGCDSGNGSIDEGEGIMSLARGFAYAGCPSTVMALWPIDDYTTSKIINIFLQKLADGVPKNKALKEAKLEYLETADSHKSHPFYWGALTLIGDTESIQFDKRAQKEYIILIVISTAVFLLLLTYIIFPKTFNLNSS